jgi:hypothetical protein
LFRVVNQRQLYGLHYSYVKRHQRGFLVNIDFPTKVVRVHRINCRHCNPKSTICVRPLSKMLNKTGDIWYADNRQEAIVKALLSLKKGYRYSECHVCKP